MKGPIKRQSFGNTQKATRALATFDAARHASHVGIGFDQAIAETLVIAFPMIMFQVSSRSSTQRVLAEENHPVEAFFFQAAVKAFEVCIAIGRLRRQQDGPSSKTS